MKFKLIFFLIALFSNSFLYANDSISKYLLFSPQKMSIQSAVSAIEQSQIPDLENLLNLSLQEATAGKRTLHTTAGAIAIDFQINVALSNHDSYTLEIHSSEINSVAKNRNALRFGKQTLLQLLNFAKSEKQPLPNI